MAEIFPFRAYRYNSGRIELSQVLTQPYDKITPEMQERYYAASPYNLISIEKGCSKPGDTPANNVYTRAAQALEDWVAQGILLADTLPAIYAYFQEFALPGSLRRRLRRGFIALGRLEDYSAGIVFRHERTLTAPKADRLELLRHVRAQTGQLFMLYDDPARQIDALLQEAVRHPAVAEVQDEYGVTHRLWPITEAEQIYEITAAMADKKLIIADGHHRYETALSFREECRARAKSSDHIAPCEVAMMTFFNIRDEGLTILPTHRVIRGLSRFTMERLQRDVSACFDWYAYPFASTGERASSYQEFRRDLEKRGRSSHALGAYSGSGAFFLFILRKNIELEHLLPDVSAAQRRLDVVLLHRLLLEKGLGITAEAVTAEKNVTYEREMDAAIAAVDRREAQLAFLLNPVRVEQVAKIALAGEVLPQKSTDFYPKLLSGLCIYRL